jgi:uncharacterized protein with FMN-binding domain
MKKFFISAAFVMVFGAYVTYTYFTNMTNAQAVASPVSTSSVASGTQSSPATATNTASGSSAPPTKTVTATTTSKGKYVNGTYTGSVADAYYGNLQVQATISGGKLTNVTFLQYPNDRSTSRTINQQAMSTLKQEAIQAQSANVDGVSGASDSSTAFKQSLASALSQASA